MPQQRYTAIDNETGKKVTFEWHAAEPPTDAELEEVFAASRVSTADQGPREASVMDERGIVDKAVDWLPSIGGTIGGFLGRAPLVGTAAAGLGGAAGELGRQGIRLAQGRGEEVPDTLTDALSRAGWAGFRNAAQEGGGRIAVAGLSRVAPKLMDAAMGAQKIVRRKFPAQAESLPGIAVRERIIPGTNAGIRRAERLSREANAAVPAQAAAIDAGQFGGPHGAAMADVLPDLEKLRGQFVLAGADTEVKAIDDYIAAIRSKYPRSAVETSARRQYTQTEGRTAQPSANDPRIATANRKAAAAESKGLTRISHREDRMPGMGRTLKRSQELIALEKATKNVPSARLASSISVPTYALRRTIMSPPVLGAEAIAADFASQALQGPGARIPDALLRQALLRLFEQQEQEQE